MPIYQWRVQGGGGAAPVDVSRAWASLRGDGEKGGEGLAVTTAWRLRLEAIEGTQQPQCMLPRVIDRPHSKPPNLDCAGTCAEKRTHTTRACLANLCEGALQASDAHSVMQPYRR